MDCQTGPVNRAHSVMLRSRLLYSLPSVHMVAGLARLGEISRRARWDLSQAK